SPTIARGWRVGSRNDRRTEAGMSVFVVGGTGIVGREAVGRILDRGQRVSVLVPSAESARSLPEGALPAPGDLRRPGTPAPALEGMERLLLITPMGADEAALGGSVVAAAREAGLRRIVYLSAHGIERAPHVPHYRAKIRVERAIEEADIAFTILRAGDLYQNDLASRAAILHRGLYPLPFRPRGVSRLRPPHL